MMKRNVIAMAVLLMIGQLAFAQQKQGSGATPDAFYRGTLERKVIDHASIRILYAWNAGNINDMNTYLDLGQLQIGKTCTKYCSLFAERADSVFSKWRKEHPNAGAYSNSLGMAGRESGTWSEYQWSALFFRGDTLTEWATMPFRIFQHYRYSEPVPTMRWTLSTETQTICEHRCQKAICHWRGRDYVAWFTSAIPLKSGPWKFGGLPGLIMKIYDTKHLYTWETVSVENGSFPIYQLDEHRFKDSERKKVLKMQRDWNMKYRELAGVMRVGSNTPVTTHYPFDQLELE